MCDRSSTDIYSTWPSFCPSDAAWYVTKSVLRNLWYELLKPKWLCICSPKQFEKTFENSFRSFKCNHRDFTIWCIETFLETKIFETDTETFLRQRLYFWDKIFWHRNLDFFLIPILRFFWDKIFPILRLYFWDQNSRDRTSIFLSRPLIILPMLKTFQAQQLKS